ncbi:MAG: septum formation initiator family protein [Patescibacteria group bacterium]|nr:septum formation initiator family protein [Patescibacteria group bacterium]MDD4304432.1 septum formation initiator family protein [Patescibacteria group bacterium]MDD4695455.1 septum formation initiator family protein [Patescibacteria group bacterium]
MIRQNNSSFFRILSSKLFFFIFFVVVVFMSINVYSSMKQRMQVNKEIENLKSEINNLKKENTELDSLVKYFNSDEYIETSSREKLGYKKPGEKIVVFTQESDIKKEEAKINKESKSNIRLWWDYFFNIKTNEENT